MATKTKAGPVQITADLLKRLRPEMDAALEEVGRRHGLTIKTKNASYSAMLATFKVEVLADDPGLSDVGVRNTAAAQEFLRLARGYGLQPTDLGRTVTIRFRDGLRECKITGLAPKSRKYPVLCEVTGTGKVFKFSAATVVAALTKEDV